MNKNILEKLIMKSFDLSTRKDFREENKGKIIPLDLNLECDLAYVRMHFKRLLASKDYKEIQLRDNKLNLTLIDLDNSLANPINLKVNKDREKVLKSIENWCKNTVKEGLIPEKIILK